MSGRIHRMLRKQAGELTQRHAKIIAPTLNAALQNEEITRKRVDALESHAKDVDALLQRSLMGRLRWLLLGR